MIKVWSICGMSMIKMSIIVEWSTTPVEVHFYFFLIFGVLSFILFIDFCNSYRTVFFWYHFSWAPFTNFRNIVPRNVLNRTDPLALISLIIYGPIHSVCRFLGFPFTRLLYSNARSPADKLLFLMFRSC